jgi:opacity protein-like surface antigen
MTRSLRLLGLTAALAMPAVLTAQASSDKPVSFGVSGGLSLPLGDFGEARNSGYAVAGHLYFKPASLKAIRLRADAGYDRWDFDGANANTRNISFVGNVLYEVPMQSATSITRPYLLGGLGLHSIKTTSGSGTFTNRSGDTNLGLQVGAGLTFQLSGFSTFAEAKLVNVFTEGQSTRYLPITFGVRF